MGRKSENFPIVLSLGTFAIFVTAKFIYEDLFKAAFLRWLEQYFGVVTADFMSRLGEISIPLFIAISVVWFLCWYIRKEYSRRSLEIDRSLERPAGEFGYYRAYITVRNTSPYEKLTNCRCEIVELRDEDGDLLLKNIGLRTKNQEGKDVKGRFNLDQGASKDLPVFDINQADDELTIIHADGGDISIGGRTCTALIRGYGDSGSPDEMLVRINSRNGDFEVVR